MALEGTLEATVSSTDTGSERVEFAFTVRNDGTDPIELQFTDGATVEVTVQEDGDEVWRYTEGRLFTQMLQTDRLEPGGEKTYRAEWHEPNPGEYTAIAHSLAQERDCEGRTRFSV